MIRQVVLIRPARAHINGDRVECARCGRLLMQKHIDLGGDTLVATIKCKRAYCDTLHNVYM
jgi:formylmethanofuran dehydrogenase subunit E